jgi:hypothetical protein
MESNSKSKVKRKRVVIQDVNRATIAEAAENANSVQTLDVKLINGSSTDVPNPLQSNSHSAIGNRHEMTLGPKSISEISTINHVQNDDAPQTTSESETKTPERFGDAYVELNRRGSDLSALGSRKLPTTLYDFERQWKSFPSGSQELLDFFSVC